MRKTRPYLTSLALGLVSGLLTLTPEPVAGGPAITRQPTDTAVPVGGEASFSVEVQGIPPITFQWWFFPIGASNGVPVGGNGPVLRLTNVQPHQAGGYRVVVQDPTGSATSVLAQLIVLSPPFITLQPQDTNAPVGSRVTFRVNAGGTPPLFFQWQWEGRDLPGQTNTTLVLSNVQPPDAGRYRAVVTNSLGVAVSSEAMLSLYQPPFFIQPPQDVRAIQGQDVTLSVVAGGVPLPTFQWRHGTLLLPGETNSQLVLRAVQPAQAGDYFVQIANPYGSFWSAPATVTVVEPPVITLQPTSQSVPAGAQVLFVAQAAGTEPLSYQWHFNWGILPDATNHYLLLSEVRLEQSGSYQLRVTNEAGTAWSEPAWLDVFLGELPLADQFADSVPWSGFFFYGHGLNTFASREAGEPWHAGKRGSRSVWLSWVAPASGIATVGTEGSDFDTLLAVYTGQTLDTLQPVAGDDDSGLGRTSKVQFNAVAGMTYHIAVDGSWFQAGNVVLRCDLTESQVPLPWLEVWPPKPMLCPGQCADLTVMSDGVNLVYEHEGVIQPVPTGNLLTVCAPGLYRFSADNSVGNTASVLVEVQGNSLCRGDVAAQDKLGNALLSPLLAQDQAIGTVGPSAPVGESPPSDTLTSRGFSFTQVFSTAKSSSDPGEPPHCGLGPARTKWFVYQAPTNGTLRVTTAGSSFDTVLAVYALPGLEVPDYSWLYPVACNDDARPGVLSSDIGFPAAAGQFYAVAVDGYGGAAGQARLNFALGEPVFIVTHPQSCTVAPGAEATFSVEAGGMADLTYQWRFNGVDIPDATNESYTVTATESGTAGAYDVVVQNPINSVTSQVAVLTVSDAPVIQQDPMSQAAPVGGSVQFSVRAGGTEPLFYQWFFNGIALPDATNATLTLSNLTVVQTGEYAVLVWNDFGNAASAPAFLTVFGPPEIYQQPMDQDVPLGGAASFYVGAAGFEPLWFQWRRNGAPIEGATNQALFLQGVGLGDEGFYSVEVSNAAGSVVSSAARLKVLLPPLILQHPGSQSVPAGARVFLTVQATGSPPLFYQWVFGGSPIEGATNPVLMLSTVTPANSGTYQVWVYNAAGSVLSEPATLDVTVAELPFADHFADRVLTNGYQFKGHGTNLRATREPFEPFHDQKRGSNSVWISWQAPADGIVRLSTEGSDFDTLLAVYTGDFLSNLVVVASDDDNDSGVGDLTPFRHSVLEFNAVQGMIYHIAVDGQDAHRGHIILELTFTPTLERLPCFLTPPWHRVLRKGEPWCFEFTPCDLSTLDVILWTYNDSTTPLGNTTRYCIPSVTEAEVGVYRVELRSGNRIVRSRRFELQFNSAGLTNTLATDKLLDAVEFKHQVAVQSLVQGLSRRGTKDAGTGTSGYLSSQVFSTYGATPEPGEPAHCGIGPFHSKWYAYEAPTNGTMCVSTEGSTFPTVLAVYIGPGTEFATLTNVACAVTNVSNATSTWCEVTFPATAGTIYYIAVDSAVSNLTGTVTLTMILGNPVSILTPPQSQNVWLGSNATFNVVVGGMTNYAYQWRFNGTNLPGATNATYTRSNALPAHAGNYDVVVQNPINTVTSAVATLTVLAVPVITQHPVSMAVRAGSNATLSANASGSPTPWTQWFFNNAPMTDRTNLSLTITNFQATNQGRYFLRVTNLAGAAQSAEVELWMVTTQSVLVTYELTNGAFRVRAASPITNRHVLEASTTLTNWVPLATNNAPFGIVDFLDLDATNFAHRFYRARPE